MREAIRTYILERITVEDRGHSSPCWTWQQWTNEKGYAVVDFRGSRFRVHRASYEVFKEPIPCWLETDHLCCNASCVNPDHLEPVTRRENRRRQAIRRGETVGGRRVILHPGVGVGGAARFATHCLNGHEYEAPGQVGIKRVCKACLRANRARNGPTRNATKKANRAKAAAQRKALGGRAAIGSGQGAQNTVIARHGGASR